LDVVDEPTRHELEEVAAQLREVFESIPAQEDNPRRWRIEGAILAAELAAGEPAWSQDPMTQAAIATLAGSIRALLADPEAGLSTVSRYRWEGALVACEAILGGGPAGWSLRSWK
jgi:hypothetical protein